ncbi:hypothetical protein BJ508DRAFT_178209 [Ascobolus immersus RN42]|uniref:Uncharacterized protein n=1 Tax=Ascobolus immersus RN42 TaxID=1160509 RepID=A0A3N4IHC4_ASCIM|nr:hypothetical protein BJ508DRAFT_178209 [Ascobolus immersus RN42]
MTSGSHASPTKPKKHFSSSLDRNKTKQHQATPQHLNMYSSKNKKKDSQRCYRDKTRNRQEWAAGNMSNTTNQEKYDHRGKRNEVNESAKRQ